MQDTVSSIDLDLCDMINLHWKKCWESE